MEPLGGMLVAQLLRIFGPVGLGGVSLPGLDRPPIVATTDLGVGQLFGHLGVFLCTASGSS